VEQVAYGALLSHATERACEMTMIAPAADILTALPSGRANDPAIFYRGSAIGYAELEAKIVRAAAGLARLGLVRGDRLAVWLPNVPAWLVLFFAAARLGVLVVAINTRFRSHEVADMLGRSGAKALALWPAFKGIDFAGILAEVPADARSALLTVIAYDEGEPVAERIAGCPTVRYGALEGGRPFDEATALERTTPSILFTTSGTTRAPKFVLHTHGSIVAHARDVGPGFGFTAPGAVLLQALPLCGVFGFCQAMAALSAGRPMIMLPIFDGAEAARLIAHHEVTHLNGTDEMFFRIMDAADLHNFSLASLRLCGYAAFANAQGSALVAEGDRRGIPYVGLYGMSEVQALFARQPETASTEQRALAGGMPVSPHGAYRVRDPESGKLLPPGEAGELELNGPSRFAGYWGDEEATGKALTADGFMRTGDLAHIGRDGGFVYLARMGDSLRLGGFLVNPAEIEAFIEEQPGIAGCQVVGVARGHGAEAVGFVTLENGVGFDEQSLRARCAGSMAKYKVPVRIFPLDAFPVTVSANGAKIQRAKLREMAEARLRMN